MIATTETQWMMAIEAEDAAKDGPRVIFGGGETRGGWRRSIGWTGSIDWSLEGALIAHVGGALIGSLQLDG